MPVHISEVHTDIRPAGAEAPAASEPAGAGGRTADEQWRESCGRIRWLEARTSASGYED